MAKLPAVGLLKVMRFSITILNVDHPVAALYVLPAVEGTQTITGLTPPKALVPRVGGVGFKLVITLMLEHPIKD